MSAPVILLVCLSVYLSSFFHKLAEIGNNDNIGITDCVLCENKKLVYKMLPQCILHLGPQPLESDDLLSEPLRHVLLGRSKICIWSYSIGSN